MEDGGDVVGVAEPARRDEARQQRIDIVMVRLSRRSSAASGPNASDSMALSACSWVSPEPPDEGGPAVVLGCGGDGLVLGGERSDRAPLLLFGNDGLVRREPGATVLQNAVEHASRGGNYGSSPGVWLRVVVGAVEGHVGVVRVPSSGHRDVEGLPRRGRLRPTRARCRS